MSLTWVSELPRYVYRPLLLQLANLAAKEFAIHLVPR
jgi:hypothetical protein